MGKLFLVLSLICATNAWGSESNLIPDGMILLDDMLVQAPGGLENYSFGAVKLNVELWPDGVLPFHFADNISSDEKSLFFDACHDWEKSAHIRCQEGRYQGRQISVSKINGIGCWSLWGMGTSFLVLRRLMNLSSECWNRPLLIHEMGHALGLIHEHQRIDRDRYVEVYPENAEGGFLGLNLKINFDSQAGQLLTPYDFRSIMHYDRQAFSKNGEDTLVPRVPYEEYLDVIGRGGTVSEGDVAAVQKLYGKP